MGLAGIWQAQNEPLSLFLDGQEPFYQFRFEGVTPLYSGVLSQGAVQRLDDGAYLGTGQGVWGNVRFRCWLSQPDVLQWQNQKLVDGGLLDGLVGAFLPGVANTQPVMTFFRQQPVAAPAPVPLPAPQAAPKTDAREAARLLVEAAAEHARKEDAKAKVRRKAKQPAESTEDPLAQLGKLIGMGEVKSQIERLDAWAWRQRQIKEHDKDVAAPSLHMSFAGGPGTGKTTVARIIGRLLKKYELLAHGSLQEVGRSDLVAEFIGQTASKTEKVIEEGIGGVLFIDEAYALSEPGAGAGGQGDFGKEALATLIAGMENHRHELCVIVAGYPAEMDRFIDANAGLASRISRHIKFPDFTDQELEEVFRTMAKDQGLDLDPKIIEDFQPYIRRAKAVAKARQWGNARTVRNIFERGIENQSVRLRKAGKKPSREQLFRLELADFAFFSEREVSIT